MEPTQHAAWRRALQGAVAVLLGIFCVVLVQELKEVPRLLLSAFPLLVWVVPLKMRPTAQALVLAVLLCLMGMMLGFSVVDALTPKDRDHPVMPMGAVMLGMPVGAVLGLFTAWRHARQAVRPFWGERVFLTLCAINMGLTSVWRVVME